MAKAQDPLFFEIPWRPNFEAKQAIGWGIAAVATASSYLLTPLSTTLGSAVFGVCGVMAMLRGTQAYLRAEERRRLGDFGKEFVHLDAMQKITEQAASKKSIWLGSGFPWTDIEASKLHWLLGQGVVNTLGKLGINTDGAYWVHGLSKEEPVYNELANLVGHTLVVGTTRVGKAQPVDSLVHTPDGWKRMGDIRLGDTVSTPDGGSAKVLEIFPQGVIPTYRLTLEDGREVKASGDHLWEVHHKHWHGKYKPGVSRAGKALPRVMTTLELKVLMERNKGAFKLRLPCAVEKPKQNLPIHPYVMGCILGDGLIGSGNRMAFCNADPEIIERIRGLLPPEVTLKHIGPREIDFAFVIADHDLLRLTQERKQPGRRKNPFKLAVENLGLSNSRSWEKHVPDVYKESCAEDRLELLRGLMDTDGTVTKTGVVQFDTVSKQLARDVQEIVWSLGGIATIREKERFYTVDGERKQGRLSYHITIRHSRPSDLLACARKRNRAPEQYRHGADNLRLRVTGIEECGADESQCILIDHPDHLYITDNYVVTHNTRLYDLLITQAILRGECVIIIDPKGDHGLAENARKACEYMGQPDRYVYFHPAHPDKSACIDPLKNWNRKTELASRVSALIPSEGGGDPFQAFGWKVLNDIVNGLILTGERPNLLRLRRYVESSPESLVEKALERHFDINVEDWRTRCAPYMKRFKDQRVMAYINFYRDFVIHDFPMPELEGLISTFEHNRDHFQKMIASLIPILSMLTSAPLKDLLSPEFEPGHDRVVTDMARIIRDKKVAYIGLDSLADGTVGSAIGSILLADLTAVAGDRYNYGLSEIVPVNLFIDEAAEVINDPTIQLMNKAGGAQFRVNIATQTFADFASRLGDENKARQVLGNANNKIALRVLDKETQEYIAEGWPKIKVKTMGVRYGHNVNTQIHDEYSASYQEQITETEADLFPAAMLGELPPLHYIAKFSGGRTVKGRIPILLTD